MCMLSWLRMKPRLDAKIFLILVITLACGAANINLIGNLNYVRLLVLFLSFFVGQLILSDRIDAKVFLNIYLIYALFLLFRIATQGLGNPIFTYLSNKYGVSDNAIRQWCKRYGLPYQALKIRKISDEELEYL